MNAIYIFPYSSLKATIKQHFLLSPVKSGYITLRGWNDKNDLIYYNSPSCAYGNFDDCTKFSMDLDVNGFHYVYLYADTQGSLDYLMDFTTYKKSNCIVRLNRTELITPKPYHGFRLSH